MNFVSRKHRGKRRFAAAALFAIAAGLLLVLSTVLAATISRKWLVLTGFVGVGLTFAGLTDFCPMGILLAAMPWNGTRKCILATAQKESCRL